MYFLLMFLMTCSSFLYENISFPHSCKEKTSEQALYPISKQREEGFLNVSSRHSIYYATYGNPDGIPVVLLHGGPGGGCHDSMTKFFDLNKWNVVMFDQRGAMRSEPFACMEENTSHHSIDDIEALRNHLGIDKWVVFGGSWGSTLAMLYGQEHPEQCLGFILRGVWLVREQDYSHLFYGMGKIFPEAYESVVNFIPEEERNDLLSAYYRRICNPDPSISLPAAQVFMNFDFVCATHLPNQKEVEMAMKNNRLVLSVAKAFCHYAKHDFFIEPNQILSRMDRISHLPALIVQGRWDAICLPEMAYLAYKSWNNSQLWMIPNGGHSANDPGIASALTEATDLFSKKLFKQ